MSITRTIFHSKTVPYQGLASKPSIVTVSLGKYTAVKNWRLDENTLRVRYPMTRSGTDQGATAMASNFVGAWVGLLNGTLHIVASTRDDGAVYSFAIVTGEETVLISTSGTSKYGNTTLSTSHLMVSFAPVKDNRTGKEYLVISDGVSYPRVWDPSVATAGEKVAINQPIANGVAKTAFNSVVTFPKYFNIKNLGTWSKADTGAGYTSAETGSGTVLGTWTHTITTGVASPPASPGVLADYTTGTFTAIDATGCQWLYALIDTGNFPNYLNNIRVDIGEGGAPSTIWDASAGTTKYKEPIKKMIGSTGNLWLVGFSMAHVADSGKNALDTVRVGWVGAADPNNTKTIVWYGIFASGKVQGQCAHATALLNQGSRAEAPGVFFDPTDVTGEYFKNMGCSDTLTSRVPNVPEVFYQYNLNIIYPTTAQMQAGVDAIAIYRSDPGEDLGYRSYVKTVVVATWSSPTWSFSTDSAGTAGTSAGLHVIYDNTEIDDKDYSVAAPDTDCLTIPKGIWMASTPERLFVLSYETTGSYEAPSYSAMWASDVFAFSRFYRFHKSEESGTRVAFQGETATCLKTMPTSVYGVSTMLLWTNSAIYRFSPTSASAINQIERIGPYGTWCPYSVAASQDSIFWVDQTRVVRRYSGNGIEDLSSYSIGDKLSVVGGATWNIADQSNGKLFFGGFWNERYYLSCDQGGTNSWSTNTETPLIYETRINPETGQEFGWMEDTLGHAGTSTRFWLPTQGRLVTTSKDGFIYQYEDPSSGQATDGYQYETSGAPVAGTGYTATIKTGAIFPDFEAQKENGFVPEFCKILCDDFTSGTVTATADMFPSRSTFSQTVTIDGSNSVIWATAGSTRTADSGTELRGVAAAFQLVFSSGCAGVRLYGWQETYRPDEYRPSAA